MTVKPYKMDQHPWWDLVHSKMDGRTWIALGRKMGWGQHKLTSRRRSEPRMEDICAVAKALGIDAGELLTGWEAEGDK